MKMADDHSGGIPLYAEIKSNDVHLDEKKISPVSYNHQLMTVIDSITQDAEKDVDAQAPNLVQKISASVTNSPSVDAESKELCEVSSAFSFDRVITNASCVKRTRGRPRKDCQRPIKHHLGQSVASKVFPGRPRFRGRKFQHFLMTHNPHKNLQDMSSVLDVYEDIDSDLKPACEVPEKILLPSEIIPDNELKIEKFCSLCNLSEKSLLGQGKLKHFKSSEGFHCFEAMSQKTKEKSLEVTTSESGGELKLFFKKQKLLNCPGEPLKIHRSKSLQSFPEKPSLLTDLIQELELTGFKSVPESSDIFEQSGELYAHFNCAAWSEGVTKTFEKLLSNVDKAVVAAAFQKCSKCGRFGASVRCCVSDCTKIYHYPCAIVSGALQNANCFKIICSIHLEDAFSFGVICMACHESGDLSMLLLCTSCSNYYHGNCMDPPITPSPDVRAGWQCLDCKVCQNCRQPDDSSKMIVCNTCDKGYHTFCVKPAVASVPKSGWKCSACRMCGDCGARTPGNGPSSRWHLNYSVCDSCYQQRNKGIACPLCGKAYRQFSQRKVMKHCTVCQKYIHEECDKRVRRNSMDYVCPICTASEGKHLDGTVVDLTIKDNCSSRDSFLSGNEESLSSESEDGAIDGVPAKISHRRTSSNELRHKKSPKPKYKAFSIPNFLYSMSAAVSQKDYKMDDDDPTEDNKLILASATDEFVLCQDLCVMCGSFGRGEEGRLICCAQCGQCYHSYCVSVKVTTVVLKKGWRCLDCTVCEGCGQPHDEGRLLLCDECDISFHIYCLDPPLQEVPQGNWKCKWCVNCIKCGSKSPGLNCDWQVNYTLCGPCASFTVCCLCQQRYEDTELIIQCSRCERWLHGLCDQMETEDDAEKCAEYGYTCPHCRSPDELPPHLLPPPRTPTPEIEPVIEKHASPVAKPKDPEPPVVKSKPPVQYFLDGVCLSESGLQYIKSLSPEQPKKIPRPRKIKQISDSVRPFSFLDRSNEDSTSAGATEDTKMDAATLEELAMKAYDFEEGKMVVDGSKEEDKKKRPRKLQKLGIGGFSVKPRGRLSTGKDSAVDSDVVMTPVTDSIPTTLSSEMSALTADGPESNSLDKPKRKRKPKKKTHLDESFPVYLRDAFFGKDLLLSCKKLAKSEVAEVAVDAKTGEPTKVNLDPNTSADSKASIRLQEDTKDFLPTSGLAKSKDASAANIVYKSLIKSEIESIKEEHLSSTSMETSAYPGSFGTSKSSALYTSQGVGPSVMSNLHHPDSNSSWPDSDCDQSHMQKNILKWESDEHLGLLSTISPVLYANINLPHLKIEFPAWVDRVKQIAKIWRGLPPEKRQPYLQRARENRAASRTSQRSNSSELDKSQKEVRTPSDVDPEKQWKQFQAMRQLQHQAQQRLLQEQRTQAAMKSQVEKPIGSPAVADMDKNLKLFHSKSMSEIPQFPSLATDDGPSKEGAHKIFEKRWSSSALDLNAAHAAVQGNKLKMEMPVSSQPSFIKDNIQNSPLMSGRTSVYGPRVLGGSPSMEPQLSIPDASVPSTGMIKSSDHLLHVSPSSSQSISQITNSPVPVLAGKDEVPRVSSVAQKENSMVTPPATPRPHSSDSFFQMTASPQSQLLASLDSHSQPTPARTPTTYEMTKSSSSVVQSTPNFNMGNKVSLQPSTSSPKSSLQPPAQQFVLHQGSLTPANIAKQLSQYKETFGSISSTQATAKNLLSPQQEKPIEQQNLEQFLNLPYSGKVNQHQQLRDLLQNKDRSNEGNTHSQATNQSHSLPGSIAVSSTSTSATTAVSSTSHITSSAFSNNQTSQALSDNRQQQTILNRFTDNRQQQILVDNRYNDNTQQQTAVDTRFIDNKQQQQSVSNRFNDNKQQISVDSSLLQASVDNRFHDGRQQQTSVNRLSDDRKQQSSLENIFHDSRQQQSSVDNRINDGRQQQPSVDNRQMQSSVEKRFNEGRQQQALADSRFNDNRQQQTSVDNRFSDGRQQQTSVDNRFSENRQQHAIVDSRLHENRQQQASVDNRFNSTQQQTSIDNRQQQASVDNRFNTNRQQQASIDNRQQQVPIDSRQQQVSIDSRQQQMPIDSRQQQGPIDSRQHQLSNDNRQQQAPIGNGQQQAAIDNKQQISIENEQKQASIDDRQQASIDNIQQASIDNIQQTSIDNKQQLQAPIDNRSQQACIDNRFNENRQQHAPEHQQITVERVPQSSLEKDLMVDNGNEKRANTSVVEDVCLPILDSKDDPKDEACPDLNKKRKTTAGDLVKDLETEPEEHDVIAANCSLYALSTDVGELELDDEELLGLGNDFNILEYADPELDKSLVGEGDKNNILDEHLDLDDKDEELEEDVIKDADASQEKDLISQEMSGKKAIEIANEKCKEPDKGSDLPENFLDFDKKNIDSRFESSFQPKGLDSDNPSHEALSTVKEEPKQAFSSCSLSPQTYSPSINIKLEKTTPENCPKSLPMAFGNESQGINSSRIQCPSDSGVPPPSYRMVTALKQTLSSHQGPLMQQQSKGMFPLHLNMNLSQQGVNMMDTNKPLLLQEQPLLLAELVEQEKREQRRQTQEGLISPHGDALLSDIDFERLKDDVFSGPPDDSLGAPGSLLGPHEPGAVSPSLSVPSSPSSHSFGPPPYSLLWQNQDSPGALAPRPVTSGFMQTVKKAPVSAVISQLGLPNAGLIQKAPNMPGVSIPTRPFNPHLVPSSPSIMDPEKLKLLNYEKQLLQQQALLSSQQKYVETEVIKLRKVKKALNAKQRQLRKNGAELAENDSLELARVSQEQAGLQKQLDQVRKQTRQNTVAIQDFRLKQQKKQQQPPPPQPVPRSHPVVNSSPQSSQSPLQFTHATPSSPSVRLHSPSHLMQPGTPLFSQQLQMPKQENTSWPSPLKMPASDLQAADRFLKREQFDRNVSQTFPLSSSTQSPQADITLKSLMDIKKNLGEETFKPISGSAPHVPGESTEQQQQSFSAKSADTVQTPSLLKEPKIEAVSTAPSTVSQSILSQSLPSSVSNTLKFTLRQTGMPTGCLPTDATAENPNELGYGVDADLPASKLCDSDPVVVLESKPETPRNENGIEVQTSAKSPDPKHNLIKQETSNLHEESQRVKPDVKIEPNSEKNVPSETSVVGELLTHIKQEIMDDLPAENTNAAQMMSGECESGQKQKEDGHEGSSDEELEGMASKIPEAGGEQNVLLKQLLQNCPSAETRKTADDFIGLRKEGEEASKLELAFSVDDLAKAKMEDPKSKKPTYLDIRRAQLDKEPTPPPGEKPKAIKRKRPKKKKLEAPEGGVLAKKKCRRSSSKIEEGYETYVETLMNKLTSLPPLRILEPNIKPNFSAVPVFGAGDLNVKENQLKGSYGSATLPDQIDIYSFYPYTKEQPPISTILPPSSPPYRGFYNQEFPAIAKAFEKNEMSLALKPPLDIDHFKVSRDAGSPDTVISSSSPESCLFEPLSKWPKLIFVDKIQPESKHNGSPVIPLMYPVPLRFFPKEWGELDEDKDKENIPDDKMEMGLTKTKMSGIGGYSAPLKDSGNVAVTLTLSSAAAEDICGVLSALADLLKIPIPASYEIVERTATPPSQKLGLYRRSKNSEVSIHSLLNGKPRFCRHCDIVVLSAGIRKKASDLPCISKEEQEEEDEVIFCSTNCYMQFALTHRSTAILEEKEAAAVVDHIGESVDSKYLIGEDSLGALVMDEREELEEGDLKLPQDMEVDPSEENMLEALGDEKYLTSSNPYDIDLLNDKMEICDEEPMMRKWKSIKYKYWSSEGEPMAKPKRKEDSNEKVARPFYHTIKPSQMPKDERKCIFCHSTGDGDTSGAARLLNMDVNKWVHLNCALWSYEVYETVNGALMNVEVAFKRSRHLTCYSCHKQGASVRCFKTRCPNVYHFPCAKREHCAFFKDKTVMCPQHVHKGNPENQLDSTAVFRRVYINREEHKQVASMIQDEKYVMRVGSLIFLNIGQLLPTQIQAFHNTNCIYPVGYKVIRMYWSMRKLGRRSQYICTINEVSGKPEFTIQVKEFDQKDVILKDKTAKGVWQKVLYPIEKMRKQAKTIKIFPDFITGDDLFGLAEPAVLRIVESLPGVDTLYDYNFRYGRSPFLELPLAINPTGCARSEPKLRTHFKRSHTLHTSNTTRSFLHSAFAGFYPEVSSASSPYIKQFVHSKSSQYRKMKTEWRNNVYLARSRIQGLGLYAARDMEKHTMVIEYIGQLIRNEIAERNEAIYDAQNRGTYMFRLDENRVIDATMSGGLARYINHSCNPNCVTEAVQIDRENKIIIITNRRVTRGEELSYDYKFEVEDDQHKIPCLCGAPNCRKWMN